MAVHFLSGFWDMPPAVVLDGGRWTSLCMSLVTLVLLVLLDVGLRGFVREKASLGQSDECHGVGGGGRYAILRPASYVPRVPHHDAHASHGPE